MKPGTQIVVCQYTAKPGQEAALEALLRQHWPCVHRLGLASDEPAVLMKGEPAAAGSHDAGGKYIEIFSWRDETSMKRAHQEPELMKIWEGIGACCSDMDFPGFVVFE